MKLRIKGNSIRLRLCQSEVLRLAIDGTVEDFTEFGPFRTQRLGYAICAAPELRGVNASFTDCRIIVRVPGSILQRWAMTDQVSIEALQRTGGHADLRILIEKDFQCIDAATGESQEDAFPNPRFGSTYLPANTIARPA